MTTNNGWPLVALGALLKPTSRRISVSAETEYELLGARWYAKGLYTKDKKFGSEIRASHLYQVQQGDFVYNRLFAWKGSFAVATEENDGCFVSNEFPCFHVCGDRLLPHFLWYYFSRETAWDDALGESHGATPTSRNRLKEADLLRLSIPLPPLEEQRRIVDRIDRIAAKIDEANGLSGQCDLISDSLLLAAYHKIAETAPRKPLGEVAPLVRRPAAIDTSGKYPQVSVRSFGRGTFHNPPLQGSEITWQKPYLVRAGDILVSNIKAWEGAIAVAGPDDDGRYGSHRYLTFVPVTGISTARFLCFHLLSSEGLFYVGEASPGSADRNRTLSAKKMLEIPVPVPPFEQQQRFDALLAKVTTARAVRTQATSARDAMLPSILDRAFKGAL